MLPWLLPFIWEVGENNVLKIFVVRFNHTPDTSWLFWCDCDIGHNKANHFINCLHLYFTVLWTWLLVKRVYSFQSSSSLGLHSNKELRFFVNTFSCVFFFFFSSFKKSILSLWAVKYGALISCTENSVTTPAVDCLLWRLVLVVGREKCSFS